MVYGVPYRLKPGAVQGKDISLIGTLQRDFVREVECRTGKQIIAHDARSAVILGRFRIISGDLGLELLHRIEREEFVAGRVAEHAAEKGNNCGFGLDGGGNKLATIILHPGIDD